MKKLDSFIFTGNLKSGKVIPQNPRYVRGSLQMYGDCEIRVIVEKKKKSKTREQLGYLFGVVYPEISIHTGHSVEELDKVMKAKFLRGKVLWRGGEMRITNSKSGLSSNEMAEFIQNVILEGAELGIEIPPPDSKGQIIKSLT